MLNRLKNARYRLLRVATIALTFVLASCSSNDMSDLQSYVSAVLARKGGKVEPLPPIKPYERYL